MHIEKMLESLGLDKEIFDARDNAYRSHNLVPVSMESEPKIQRDNNGITEDTPFPSSSENKDPSVTPYLCVNNCAYCNSEGFDPVCTHPHRNKTITPGIKCDCYEEISNE